MEGMQSRILLEPEAADSEIPPLGPPEFEKRLLHTLELRKKRRHTPVRAVRGGGQALRELLVN